MKQEFFTVIPQNMREYKMSIREADNENDLFRMAFDEVMEGHAFDLNNKDDLDKYMIAWDSFKDGWEAAVRLLNDDAAPSPAAKPAKDEQSNADKFCDANCVWTNHAPGCVRAEGEQPTNNKGESNG